MKKDNEKSVEHVHVAQHFQNLVKLRSAFNQEELKYTDATINIQMKLDFHHFPELINLKHDLWFLPGT